MSRLTLWIVLGGLVVAVATVLGTQYVLGLLPEGTETSPASEEASFLAHLLLPLSVSLFFFVVIAVVGGVVRLVAAILRRSPEEDE